MGSAIPGNNAIKVVEVITGDVMLVTGQVRRRQILPPVHRIYRIVWFLNIRRQFLWFPDYLRNYT